MQSFTNLSKRIVTVTGLLFVLLLALPMSAGAQDALDDNVFASVRVYEGVDPADQNEIARLVDEGFLPILRDSDGFVGYYLLPAGDMLGTVSLFETAEQAAASTDAARDFVAESLAPFLPNAPTVVEGALDVWFLAAAADMMPGQDHGSLHGSLRIYDNYNLARRDEAVELVDTIFLPMQQEADGLFSYFTMDDGVDRVAALSVYESKTNALAANKLAAEFTAEYMTDWISEAPTRINGSLGVAAFAGLQEGANLIDDPIDDGVFASVRVYDGVDPADQDDIVRLTAAGFLPIMRESDGFVGYYLLPAGDRLAAVSLFDSAGQASASNAKARDFVVENLAPLLPNPPMIVEGTVALSVLRRADTSDENMTAQDMATPLHATLAIYDGFDMTRLDESLALVESDLLPDLFENTGLLGYYAIADGVDKGVAIRFAGSEEDLRRGSEVTGEFVAEHMAGWLPPESLRLNGQLGVAATADQFMGENLAAWEIPMKQVFASVRVYDGVDPADQAEIARLTAAGFLPIMRGSDGFVGYYLLPAEDRLAAVSLFDSAEQASASAEKARDFVAENLAPLLPNAPMIVEGTVEIHTQLSPDTAADSMTADGLAMPLYALLAIYDGFDMARLDETVELVESILLPDLREAGGLFSYHGISDGVDKAVALRIMDSEASLLAGSDIAADFIAAHMAGWLPEDPLSVSGRLAVAATADLYQGENLAAPEVTDASVFASVRLYDGLDPVSNEEIARVTAAGFLPLMRESDGFVGYFLMPAGDMLAAISLFDSAEQASASAEKAREFVAENLAPLLPNAPSIFEGPLSMYHVAAPSGSEDSAGEGELHASIRLYEGFDLRHFDEANDLAKAQLLPALQELGGLFAQFALNDGEDTVVGISIFEDEDAALAANDVGKAFTSDYLAEWAPNPPTGVSGKLAIASLAEVNMGENLVGAVME